VETTKKARRDLDQLNAFLAVQGATARVSAPITGTKKDNASERRRAKGARRAMAHREKLRREGKNLPSLGNSATTEGTADSNNALGCAFNTRGAPNVKGASSSANVNLASPGLPPPTTSSKLNVKEPAEVHETRPSHGLGFGAVDDLSMPTDKTPIISESNEPKEPELDDEADEDGAPEEVNDSLSQAVSQLTEKLRTVEIPSCGPEWPLTPTGACMHKHTHMTCSFYIMHSCM
jgi:hypothetical protein